MTIMLITLKAKQVELLERQDHHGLRARRSPVDCKPSISARRTSTTRCWKRGT